MQLAFLGPLIGAVTRAGSGWVADKYGGARVTFWVFVVLMIGALGVFYFLNHKEAAYAFQGFFAMFMLLFAATGVGNASTFQMIPAIFRTERGRALKGQPEEEIRKAAELEGAATIGFSSAIGAFGAFFIPKSYGTSIAITGTPSAALIVFFAYYGMCLVITWWYYTRKKAEIRC
jgi:NNP family nitrate/nitrite transporter-like MFS transporter